MVNSHFPQRYLSEEVKTKVAFPEMAFDSILLYQEVWALNSDLKWGWGVSMKSLRTSRKLAQPPSTMTVLCRATPQWQHST